MSEFFTRLKDIFSRKRQPLTVPVIEAPSPLAEKFLPLQVQDIAAETPNHVRLALMKQESNGNRYDYGLYLEFGIPHEGTSATAGTPIRIVSLKHVEAEPENFGTISDLRLIISKKTGKVSINSFTTTQFHRRQPLDITAHTHNGFWNASSLGDLHEQITFPGDYSHLPTIQQAIQGAIDHYQAKSRLWNYEPHALHILETTQTALTQLTSTQ